MGVFLGRPSWDLGAAPVSPGVARVCSGAPCQLGRAEEWLSRVCVQREAFACLSSSLPSLPACPPPLPLPGTFAIARAVATVTWSFAPQVMRVTPRSVSVGCCHLFIESCRRSVDKASSGHVGRLCARPAGASPTLLLHAPFPSCPGRQTSQRWLLYCLTQSLAWKIPPGFLESSSLLPMVLHQPDIPSHPGPPWEPPPRPQR